MLGCKDANNKVINIDRLMSNTFIDLHKDVLGVYVPREELLKRTNFEWYNRMSPKQVLEADVMISKFLLISST